MCFCSATFPLAHKHHLHKWTNAMTTMFAFVHPKRDTLQEVGSPSTVYDVVATGIPASQKAFFWTTERKTFDTIMPHVQSVKVSSNFSPLCVCD